MLDNAQCVLDNLHYFLTLGGGIKASFSVPEIEECHLKKIKTIVVVSYLPAKITLQ